MQRIHNLPYHQGEDVNAEQNTNSSVEFPWLQVLLGNTGWWSLKQHGEGSAKRHKSSFSDFVRVGFMNPEID